MSCTAARAGWFEARDPVLHAEHLDRAEDPAAARAYLVATQAQAAGHRYETALRLVRRGLELATEPADRSPLALLEGDILHDLGVMSEALEAYTRALGVGRGRRRALPGLDRSRRGQARDRRPRRRVRRPGTCPGGRGGARPPRRGGASSPSARQSLLPAWRHRGLSARTRPGPRARASGPGARARGRGAGRAGRCRVRAWPDDQRPRPAERVRRPQPPPRLRSDRGREPLPRSPIP